MRAYEVVDVVKNYEVYSSLLIGHSAKGAVRIFTVPQGQPIQRLGDASPRLFPTHTPFTTNLWKAGQLGSGLGDFTLHKIRLDFVSARLMDVQTFLNNASYLLRVSAKIQAEGAVRDLPRVFAPIEIHHHDTLDLAIDIEHEIDVMETFLLRVIMVGDLVRDIR